MLSPIPPDAPPDRCGSSEMNVPAWSRQNFPRVPYAYSRTIIITPASDVTEPPSALIDQTAPPLFDYSLQKAPNPE